jgi:hypothetical protein
MAHLVSLADGNWTAAATWGVGDTTALVEPATLGSTALTVAVQDSAVFQPGAVTVDGVAIRLASRATGSPSNTITVTLRNSTGAVDIASVTANVSDLKPCDTGNLEGGWYFFKFNGTFLLLAATNYVIRINFSATTTAVSIATNNTAANWLHILRTTTTQTPVAGDAMHVMGEFDGASNPATTSSRTVTMNETAATDYGTANVIANKTSSALDVNNRGTVTWAITAATNFRLRLSGNLNVYSGGTYNCGQTGGSEMPRNSSALLEFDVTAADGDFGFVCRLGSTARMAGLSRTSGKNQWRAKLTADVAAAATTLNIDTDTGWLNTDEIAISSTTRTAGQHERRTLNADAGATSVVITAGLTNAHLGSGDYFAEILLLTRNVRVESTSTTLVWFFRADASAVVSVTWTSFRYVSSPTQRLTLSTTSAGSLLFQFVVIQDLDGGIIMAGGTSGGWTIDQVAIYNMRANEGTFVIQLPSTGTWTLTDVVIMGTIGPTATSYAFDFNDVGGTIGNLTACSCGASGINWSEQAVLSGNGPTFPANTTWVVHSGTGNPFTVAVGIRDTTFPRTEFWRMTLAAVLLAQNIVVDNIEFNAGFWLGNGGTTVGLQTTGAINGVNDLRLRSLDIAADTLTASNYCCLFSAQGVVAANIQFINCRFSQTSGTRVPVLVADIGVTAVTAIGMMLLQALATNCSFGGPTPVSFFDSGGALPTRASKYSYVRCPSFGQVHTVHKTFTPRGISQIETTTVDVSPSQKLSPLEAVGTPFDSHALIVGWGFLVPVLSGQAVTVSVKVQKDGSYNGTTQPQLVQLANDQIGVAADVVLATLSVGAGTFETLSGTTAAASADGVQEFIVRVYGTAGNVFVDTWTAV